MRYLTDDLLPIFLGAGRGSLSLAREIYRVYGARSVILSEEDCPRRILPFATLRPVSPRLWSEAVWDLVKKEPVGRSALLYAGNLLGVEQKANIEERVFSRYLDGGGFAPFGRIEKGDRLLTGYRTEAGCVALSRPARVLAAEGGLPSLIAPEKGAFSTEEALSLLPREGWGYFTLAVGREKTLLPFLAEGGVLFHSSGLCAPAFSVRETVLCKEGKPAFPEEAEGFAPFLWQSRSGAYRAGGISLSRYLWERIGGRTVTETGMPPQWNVL